MNIEHSSVIRKIIYAWSDLDLNDTMPYVEFEWSIIIMQYVSEISLEMKQSKITCF